MVPRYSPRIRAHFPLIFLGDGIAAQGTVINLSLPGCTVASWEPLQKGTYLALQLKMPDLDTPMIVPLAAVRWATGRLCGLEFIRMAPADQRRLATVVLDSLNQRPSAETSFFPETTRGT